MAFVREGPRESHQAMKTVLTATMSTSVLRKNQQNTNSFSENILIYNQNDLKAKKKIMFVVVLYFRCFPER